MRARASSCRPASPSRSSLLEPLERQGLAALGERYELGVLVTVGHRVEPERSSLQGRVELREPEREPVTGPFHGE